MFDAIFFVTAAASVAAIASVLAGWYFARRTERASRESYRLAADAAVQAWRTDLREWASDAIDVLAEAQYSVAPVQLKEPDPQQRSLIEKLSALIDRGRLYLPNQDRDKHGTDKHYAYRGYRHATLDPLLAALRVLDGTAQTDHFPSRSGAVWEMRRVFVSRVQEMLDPELHNAEIVRLTAEVHNRRAIDPTLGGLLPKPGTIPSGAEGLLTGRTSLPPLHGSASHTRSQDPA